MTSCVFLVLYDFLESGFFSLSEAFPFSYCT
jgi:hypothetical protein